MSDTTDNGMDENAGLIRLNLSTATIEEIEKLRNALNPEKQDKEEEISRCPFCDKQPKIHGTTTTAIGSDGIKSKTSYWLATCDNGNHYVQMCAKTRAGVIKRWNRNG